MSWTVRALQIFGVGPNLISDKATGLGGWPDEQIATAPTTGKQPDGRILAPIMPRRSFAQDDQITRGRARRVSAQPAAGEKSGIRPLGPNEKPPIYVKQLAPPASDTAAASE